MIQRVIVKVTWAKGQCRISIPVPVVEAAEFKGADYATLNVNQDKTIIIRRLPDGEKED